MQKQQRMFVIIDGPSGTGKDALIKKLTAQLQLEGLSPILISEEELDGKRDEILKAREKGKSLGGNGDKEMAEVLIEHRSDIYRGFVSPRLDEGDIVIANRGEPTTLAYQTARGELTMDAVWQMHREKDIPSPSLVVLTTCSTKTALARETEDKATSSGRAEKEAGRGLSGKVTQEVGAGEAEKLKRREAIHAQYELVRNFLERKGISVLYLDTGRMTVVDEAKRVLNYLKNITNFGDSKIL